MFARRIASVGRLWMESGDAMNERPRVGILLITYKRTDLAVLTIRGVKQHLSYPDLIWHIADDGSQPGHVETLLREIDRDDTSLTDARRAGVGKSMNLGMDIRLARGAEYILWLEDDWQLVFPFDLAPVVGLMQEREDIGMVRLGYLSPSISAQMISAAGQLWWHLKRNGETYIFAGHASLRSRSFCLAYGHYVEGLAPGETELFMCGRFNGVKGPDIAVPAWIGSWGAFAHIGTDTLKDVRPG